MTEEARRVFTPRPSKDAAHTDVPVSGKAPNVIRPAHYWRCPQAARTGSRGWPPAAEKTTTYASPELRHAS
jgi:hypothetical protein